MYFLWIKNGPKSAWALLRNILETKIKNPTSVQFGIPTAGGVFPVHFVDNDSLWRRPGAET